MNLKIVSPVIIYISYTTLGVYVRCIVLNSSSVSCCVTRPFRADFQKLVLPLRYLTPALAVREEEYVWTFPLVLLPVESCAIHLCQPLHQRGPLCVYIRLIDEQFIRLMGSARADRLPATNASLKYNQMNPLLCTVCVSVLA